MTDTPPPVTPADDVGSIVERLSQRRKELVLALPSDGSWGAAPNRAVAKRLWWGPPYLINHKRHPIDKNDWCLNANGLAARALLETTP